MNRTFTSGTWMFHSIAVWELSLLGIVPHTIPSIHTIYYTKCSILACYFEHSLCLFCKTSSNISNIMRYQQFSKIMSNVLLSQALTNRQMTLIVPVGIFSVHPIPPNERQSLPPQRRKWGRRDEPLTVQLKQGKLCCTGLLMNPSRARQNKARVYKGQREHSCGEKLPLKTHLRGRCRQETGLLLQFLYTVFKNHVLYCTVGFKSGM